MSVRIVSRDGRDRPEIFCDHCGEPIHDLAEGYYLCRPPDEELFFVHKACYDAFEQQRGGEWVSMELADFPIALGNSLNLDWEAARRIAERRANW
jgi:hypothetical protein